MHDTHLLRIEPENIVRDLGQRRLEALAVRMHADPYLESAVRRHARIGLLVSGHHWNAPAGVYRRAVRGLLAIDRQANANQPAVWFLRALTRPHRRDIDRLQRAPHGLRIVAAVEM